MAIEEKGWKKEEPYRYLPTTSGDDD